MSGTGLWSAAPHKSFHSGCMVLNDSDMHRAKGLFSVHRRLARGMWRCTQLGVGPEHTHGGQELMLNVTCISCEISYTLY